MKNLPATTDNTVGKLMQPLNLSETVMAKLPFMLAEMDYDHLKQWYMQMRAIDVVKWRVICAVIAEARMRILSDSGHGEKTEAMNQLASDFGIKGAYAYEKADIWNTFWQEPNVTDRVQPNDNHWVFQDMVHGIRWFRIALRAEKPLSAINMAQEKFEAVQADEDKYTTIMFNRDLKLEEKPEKDRLQDVGKVLNKVVDTMKGLSTDDDDTSDMVDNFVEQIGTMRDTYDEASAALNRGERPSSVNDDYRSEDFGEVAEVTPNILLRLLTATDNAAVSLLGEGVDNGMFVHIDRIHRVLSQLTESLGKQVNGSK